MLMKKNITWNATIITVSLICAIVLLCGKSAREERTVKRYAETLIQQYNTENVLRGETVLAVRQNTPLPAWRHRYGIMSGQYTIIPSEDEKGIYDLYTTLTIYETIDADVHKSDAQYLKGHKKVDTCTAVTSILCENGECHVIQPTYIRSEAEQKWTQRNLFQTL